MTDIETIDVWPSRRELRIQVDQEKGRIWIISPCWDMHDDDGVIPVDIGNLRDLIVVLDDLARKLGV